jgi:hypothetical protein
MAIQKITSGIIADGAIVATDIADGIVTNDKLAGSITSDKITSVSNTAIAGLIQSAQIGSVSNTALPTGSVLQVVSATKTDSLATSSTSFTDVTGLSVSITPTSTSSKIFIIYSITVGFDRNRGVKIQLVRDSTAICIGDSVGTRARVSNDTFTDTEFLYDTRSLECLSNNFLDSPNTTSATTYKLQIGAGIGEADGSFIFVNRTSADTDATTVSRTASTITVIEIAA